MSTLMARKTNQHYSIEANRFYGGKDNGIMTSFSVCDSDQTITIALKKKDAIDFCATIIKMMNKVG